MKWPFDEDDVWRFDDLTPRQKKYAKEEGCEAGKAYFGDPADTCEEVPLCPVCKEIVWDPVMAAIPCKHLVHVYDMNSGQEYVHPKYLQVFWHSIYPAHREELNEIYTDAEIEKFQLEGEVPPPRTLAFLEYLTVDGISSYFGDRGVSFGFVSDEFINSHGLDQSDHGEGSSCT
jgi:hypothetical protein